MRKTAPKTTDKRYRRICSKESEHDYQLRRKRIFQTWFRAESPFDSFRTSGVFEIVAAARRSSSAAVASRRRLAALRAGIGSDVLSNAIFRVSQRRRYNNRNASRANRKIIVANLNRLRSVGPGR
jgi:hypothetical protein